MDNDNKRYCYSFDEETFRGDADSPEGAAEEAWDEDPDATQCFVGETIEPIVESYVDGWRIIEDMQERAHDEAGEHADDWMSDPSKEFVKGLERVVAEYIEKHAPPKFWLVRNVRLIQREEPKP